MKIFQKLLKTRNLRAQNLPNAQTKRNIFGFILADSSNPPHLYCLILIRSQIIVVIIILRIDCSWGGFIFKNKFFILIRWSPHCKNSLWREEDKIYIIIIYTLSKFVTWGTSCIKTF